MRRRNLNDDDIGIRRLRRMFMHGDNVEKNEIGPQMPIQKKLNHSRSNSLLGAIFLAVSFSFPSPALAQEAETDGATPALKKLDELREEIKEFTVETETSDNSEKNVTEETSEEGFGPFSNLNAGEELLAEIHFDSGSTQPTYIGQRKIEHVIDELKASNPTQLRIVGFTDRTGSKELNKELSKARAENVAELLKEHGADIPVVIDPRGEENLLYPTPDGETEPLNRCVGIIVTQ